METSFSLVLDAQAALGECPVWSTREHVLYWVDIFGPSLNRLDPATGINKVMPMPADIGSFALRKPAGFVVALRTGIFLASADGRLFAFALPNAAESGAATASSNAPTFVFYLGLATAAAILLLVRRRRAS